MDHHPAGSVPQTALGTRPRQQSNATLDPNPPYIHRPDHSPRPQISRGYGSYQGGTSSNPSAQLYPVHIQSLAPKSFPGMPQPPRNPMDQRASYQPSAIHAHRTATLPNQLPPHQRVLQQHPPYVSHQSTLPPSHGHYGSPQQTPASAPIPGYSPPPSFDFIPPNVPQSRYNPMETQMSPPRQRPSSLPQGPSAAPEALLPLSQPQMQYSPEPSNQLDLPSQGPQSAVSDTDEAELALALALSEKMVVMEKEREEQLQRQEEEEFERALAQSMLDTRDYGGALHLDLNTIIEDDQIATSSKVRLDSPVWENGSRPSSRAEAHGPLSSGHAFGRYDKSLEGESRATEISPSSSVAAGKQRASPTYEDAAPPYPRETGGISSEKQPDIQAEPSHTELADVQPMLAQEEPEKIFRNRDATPSNFGYNNGDPCSKTPPPLHVLRGSVDSLGGSIDPQPYINPSEAGTPSASSTTSGSLVIVAEELRSESPSELAYFNEDEEPTTPHPVPSPPPPFDSGSAPPSLQLAVPNPPEHSTQPPLPYPNMKSAVSASVPNFMNHSFSPSPTSLLSASPPPFSQISPQKSYNPLPLEANYGQPASDRVSSKSSLAQRFQSMDTPIINSPALPPGAAPAVPLVMSSNHYIDPDLLMGVTIDFKPPVLSPQLKPMAGPVPNIVSLPYGRAHPLHIQAPSWRHMMKLLARMGNTKFEPTDNARRVVQGDAKLRTVIQFIRVHPMGNDWRTILWFTLDHPVPAKLPNANKYVNPHPNMFPWSYALMDLPVLLRDLNTVDSDMSKTYTIPATDSLPYPILPLTFPNLAVYLQAALGFSRDCKDDNTGYKKLAKMVQMCYPNMEEPSDEAPEKKTVGGLFKKVIGKKKKTGKTNNEEVFDLITPFVPDEWG